MRVVDDASPRRGLDPRQWVRLPHEFMTEGESTSEVERCVFGPIAWPVHKGGQAPSRRPQLTARPLLDSEPVPLCELPP